MKHISWQWPWFLRLDVNVEVGDLTVTESRHFQKDGDSCPEGACGSTMHITLTIEVINPNVFKVDADLESNVEDANICSCMAYVYGYTKHLSFTFDVVNILMLWCCSCWLLVERVTPAHQCLTVLYQISRASQRSSLWEHTDAKK